MDTQMVQQVEDIYKDPARALTRYGAKAHADLAVIELAILDELRRLRHAVERNMPSQNARRSS